MFVKISKSDLLQSIGFAVTAASEDLTRITEHVELAIKSAVLNGAEPLSAKSQTDARKKMRKHHRAVQHLKLIERMANFARDNEELILDPKTFKLLEANLPAR